MNKNEILELIFKFAETKPNTIGIFGYGSGVNKQAGYTSNDKPQIDLIMVVDNEEEWHKENIKLNPNNYSFSSKIFFTKVDPKWHHFATDICYLPYIKELNHTFKMGIINKQDLLDDLYSWKSFYLAGRFQKTILAVKSNDEIDKAVENNRRNAIITALLLLEQGENNLYSLFKKICSLSYLGDIRMGIAENPKKLDNLVEGGYDQFFEMYTKSNLFTLDSNNNIIINDQLLYNSINELPTSLLQYLEQNNCSKDDLVTLRKLINNFFIDKNKGVSKDQAIKGIITAGPVNSASYLKEKMMKKMKK